MGHQLALTIVNTDKTYVFTIYLITVILSVNPSLRNVYKRLFIFLGLFHLFCDHHISKYLLVNNEELTFGKRLIDPI